MKFSRTETLPDWVEAFVRNWPDQEFSTPEQRMRFVIALSRENLERDTGGPTGAAIFRIIDGHYRLYQVGVNRVVSPQDPNLHDPTAHAEMMALRMAAEEAKSHTLGLQGMPVAVLVTSIEMCGMCMNGAHWAGIGEVEIGARDEDMRAIGYNEGLKPSNWVQQYNSLGIKVRRDVLRNEANAVLQALVAKVRTGDAKIHRPRTNQPAYHEGIESYLVP